MKNGWEKGRLWWQKKGSNDHVAHLKWQNCTAIYKRHYSKPLSTITSHSCINKSCDNSIKWLWKENIGSEKSAFLYWKKKKKHTGSHKSFLAGLLPIRSFLTCTDTEGYPDPGAAPCSWFPCTSVSFRIIAFPSTVLGYFRISKLILYLH